jgi:hypothetical protein
MTRDYRDLRISQALRPQGVAPAVAAQLLAPGQPVPAGAASGDPAMTDDLPAPAITVVLEVDEDGAEARGGSAGDGW